MEMSFSEAVKSEMCRIGNKTRSCMYAELAAVLRISGTVKVSEDGEADIRVSTENAAFARRLFSFFRNICGCCPEIVIRRSNKLKKHILYLVAVPAAKNPWKLLEAAGMKDTKPKCGNLKDFPLRSAGCKKAFLRGSFLAGGSISDPEKTYHLEITCHGKAIARQVSCILKNFGLNPKSICRKGNTVIYLKEGENIVDFLNITGAHASLMEFENIRILKEMRNNVNRVVNCETANLDKIVNASVRQIENIRLVIEKAGFGSLPESLRQVAEVRLEYPDISLRELGEMLEPPLGKSGVNHRLRKLDKIAENLLQK
jgi:cell division protein WhiA